MKTDQARTSGIPLVDLSLQHREIAAEVAAGFDRVMETGDFVNGEDVASFEVEFARFCGVPHCVGVANGTDALELVLRACCIRPGDEVILPANTFVATAEAVARLGGEVVLADCDPVFHLIDVEQVARRLSPRTRAVIAVHLFGQVAPVGELLTLVSGRDTVVVEDACQAHGATQDGRVAGGLGTAAAVSFYPGKNLGAYGDGGAVLTRSDEIDGRVRAMRNHGGVARYDHATLGWNSRLDTMQAVVLRAKLRRLERWNADRAVAAGRYDDLLADVLDVCRPTRRSGNRHVWHLYVIRVPERDRILAALRSAGIGAAVHYPAPIHMLKPFESAGRGPGSFPIAERHAQEMISLPIFPGITEEQQQYVVGVLRGALN
jgi:dTDP-4-amino-4,6-dideoxygalactose transaminase